MPTTETSGITDGVSIEVNGVDQVKGPADDRLAGHEEDTAAFEARLTADAP